jgi:transposase
MKARKPYSSDVSDEEGEFVTQRWFRAGCFEAMAHDLRSLLRLAQEREPAPKAVIIGQPHRSINARERQSRRL